MCVYILHYIFAAAAALSVCPGGKGRQEMEEESVCVCAYIGKARECAREYGGSKSS